MPIPIETLEAFDPSELPSQDLLPPRLKDARVYQSPKRTDTLILALEVRHFDNRENVTYWMEASHRLFGALATSLLRIAQPTTQDEILETLNEIQKSLARE